MNRLLKVHCPFQRPLRQVRQLHRDLAKRVRQLQAGAAKRGTIAGAKLPRLSYFGPLFAELCGDGLYVIGCERPLADAIESVERIMPRKTNLAAIQQWLWDGKEKLLASVPPERQLRVEYYRVLADAAAEARRIAAFLSLTPTAAQLAKAVALIHRSMNHIKER
jgi:hypothetical protein